MKKRFIALLTLLLFSIGVFGSSAVAMATQTTPVKAGAVTVTDVPITNASKAVVNIPGVMNLELKEAGAIKGSTAYSFNASGTMPNATGSSGYVLAANQGESGYASFAAAANLSSGNLKDNLRNVVWNGYPYLAAKGKSDLWQGVNGDPVGYVKNYGATTPSAAVLYNMQVTQQAIWQFTDTKAKPSALDKEVKALVDTASKNPAPANFKLNLYDGAAAKTGPVLGLVSAASVVNNVVTVQVSNKWLGEDEKTDYTGAVPSVSYEVYEGSVANVNALLATYKADEKGNASIPLINDGKTYTIREVLASDQEDFKVQKNDQVVDLKNPVVTFNNVYLGKAPSVDEPAAITLPLAAEVSLDDKRPTSGAFNFILKDAVGHTYKATNDGRAVVFEPLTFDKEGTYVYTLTQEKGSDANINYDSAIYEVTVTVTKGTFADKPILKVKHSLKKNGVSVEGLVPVFTNTTKATTDTTSLTVKKVWKNDKTSSRPTYVDVQLYRNGSAYGELIRLNASNSWTYTWKDLDSAYKWTVNEPSVPSGYVKSLSTSGTTWTITNSGKSTPTVTTPTTNKNNSNKTTLPVTNRSTPQTDDPSQLNLWTTIGIVSLSGLCLVGILWLINRRKQGGRR